jgi:hypothetical protein
MLFASTDFDVGAAIPPLFWALAEYLPLLRNAGYHNISAPNNNHATWCMTSKQLGGDSNCRSVCDRIALRCVQVAETRPSAQLPVASSQLPVDSWTCPYFTCVALLIVVLIIDIALLIAALQFTQSRKAVGCKPTRISMPLTVRGMISNYCARPQLGSNKCR